jgi:N-acetylglucosaminyl-diphospho-decaprenol L-rhamnosyltransferase
MELSVVIVNWNTRELLAQCLDSLCGSLILKEYEVFVVDNASKDGSPAMVYERFPKVQLIENAENVGFARANNQAIRLSAGRYILLLNSDTIVKPEAIDALVDFMNAHPQAGACGARLLNQDGSLQFSCSPAPTLGREFNRLFHMPGVRPDGYYHMDSWDQSLPRRVDVILGACLLLRGKTLDQVGLMDEEYFIYSEEVDLCHRVAIAGWELYWVPQGEVIHLGGQSTRQVSEAMFLRLYQAKLIYFRKQHGRRQALLYKMIIMAAALIRMMMIPFAWLEQPLKRQASLAMAGNYKRLLLALPGL